MVMAFWNNPTGIVILLIVVLLLFGGTKIPEMMRGLGQGMKEFKKGINDTGDDELNRDSEQEKRIRARIEEEMRREDEARRQKGVS